MDEKIKLQIDGMTHYQLCSVWRFAKSGDPRISGDEGKYFSDRLFKHFGGFTPKISKALGFGR